MYIYIYISCYSIIYVHIYTHTHVYIHIYIYSIHICLSKVPEDQAAGLGGCCISNNPMTRIRKTSRIHIYIYIYIYTHVVLIYIYIYTYLSLSISLSLYIYIYIYHHYYIYIYIYIYINIYIYIMYICIQERSIGFRPWKELQRTEADIPTEAGRRRSGPALGGLRQKGFGGRAMRLGDVRLLI